MYGVAWCITAFGRMPVYSSIRFAVRGGMGAEIEAALRSEASAKEESERWKNGARGDVFARAAGGETKGRVQYTGADITAFICYVDTGTG